MLLKKKCGWVPDTYEPSLPLCSNENFRDNRPQWKNGTKRPQKESFPSIYCGGKSIKWKQKTKTYFLFEQVPVDFH